MPFREWIKSQRAPKEEKEPLIDSQIKRILEELEKERRKYDDVWHPIINVERIYKELLKRYIQLISLLFEEKTGFERLQSPLMKEVGLWYIASRFTDISNIMKIFLIERQNKFLRTLDEKCRTLDDVKNKVQMQGRDEQLFFINSILTNISTDIEKQDKFVETLTHNSMFKYIFTGGIPGYTGGIIAAFFVLISSFNRDQVDILGVQIPSEIIQLIVAIILMIIQPILGLLGGSYLKLKEMKEELGIPQLEKELYTAFRYSV